MLRRLLLALLTAAASCTPTPVFAQTATNSPGPEPPLVIGTTAIRIANESDCPVLIRTKTNGEIVGVGAIRPHGSAWFHAKAQSVTHELEIVVTPRACGLTLTPADTTPVLRPSPLGPRATW